MQQAKYAAIIALCSIALTICGCGKDDNGNAGGAQQDAAGQNASTETAKQATPAPSQTVAPSSGGAPTAADLTAAAEQNRQTMTQMNQGKQIAAVTTDALKGALPETLAGIKRTQAEAERNQAMGFDMTHAEGRYEGQDDASLSLTLTDVGNLSGTMRMGMVGWTLAQYDRKTDTGYEKTATYSGCKGMEEYDNESKSGAIRLFMADRFIVELTGDNVSMDTIKQALGQIDLKKLASLASGS